MNSYYASGRKLAARNFTNVVALSQPLNEGEVLKHVVDENERVYISSVHNIGNVEYNSLTTYNFSTASAVESIQFSKLYNSEGYVAESSTNPTSQLINPEYYYFCRDHLGNIREVWRGNRRTVVQRTQYYPSGLPWAKNDGDDGTPPEAPTNRNNRKYNGKEFVEMHGLDEYDSEARCYYPAIMRTTTIDPLAEKYYSISPYAWCANNPVRYIDPDGRVIVDSNGRTIYKHGKWSGNDIGARRIGEAMMATPVGKDFFNQLSKSKMQVRLILDTGIGDGTKNGTVDIDHTHKAAKITIFEGKVITCFLRMEPEIAAKKIITCC